MATAVAFEATPVQERLMDEITSGRSRLIGFGGGIRGTKTWGSLAAILTLCRIFPRSRWTVVRKDLERIKKSTIPSFDKLAQRTGGFVESLNRSDWIATCRNGSEILFVGENIDRDPELLRFHGFETNGFLLEEADELSERTFVKCIERAGTWIVPDGEQPDPYIFATFNPCANWPRRRFYLPWRDGTIAAPYAFIPSTSADNPFLSDAQREAWKEMPEAEYKRFVEGDWENVSGAYYDTLQPEHLIDRAKLPDPLPSHWHYWGSFDWGYGHWAVMGAWATDTDGTHYLLDSCWLRRMQDDELADAYLDTLPRQCLREVYAGWDAFKKESAHNASGESTADVFAKKGITLIQGDKDVVNRGRAVNRALKFRGKQAGVYFVKTKGNARVYDQLGSIVPDENDIRKPKKVDADVNGEGGDDGVSMVEYGLAAMVRVPEVKETKDPKLPHRAVPLSGRIKDGKLVPAKRLPTTVEGLVEWVEKKQSRTRTPHVVRSPRWK